MNIQERYNDWIIHTSDDPEATTELQKIQGNQEQLTDRFYKNLDFGTGGLRGIMEMGDNRINKYTIRKATQGLANYLSDREACPAVVIACDSRNHSRDYANQAAAVLAANQIKVFLAPAVMATPILSFCVRYYQASAGINITASHNPKEYNGYKVYNRFGVQITNQMAAGILTEIEKLDLFQDIRVLPDEALAGNPLITLIEAQAVRQYCQQVHSLVSQNTQAHNHAGLSILYTPLHGAGLEPVPMVLEQLGFEVETVAEQAQPDGNFPTVNNPNPEEPEVFSMALQKARNANQKYDLLMATDPDCDRIGIMVKDQEQYLLLTGNEVGALLCHYLITSSKQLGTMPEKPAVIKTIVTSDLARSICQAHGVALFETLTGFKYIGELLEQWSVTGEYDFMLGFEESCGYLAGDFVRDKDAIIAAALISEMTDFYKCQNQSLVQVMESLFDTYGYHKEGLLSIYKAGAAGIAEINALMNHLRQNYESLFKDMGLAAIEDYSTSVKTDLVHHQASKLTLPSSNVIKLFFADKSWIAVRPSGTEPKVKLYISVVTSDRADLNKTYDYYKAIILNILS